MSAATGDTSFDNLCSANWARLALAVEDIGEFLQVVSLATVGAAIGGHSAATGVETSTHTGADCGE